MMHRHLLTALADAAALPWLTTPSGAAEVATAWDQSQQRWASLGVTEASFAERLASVLESASPSPQTLEAIRPAEQYLVAACLQQRPGAVVALEHHAFGLLPSVTLRFASVLSPDELVQRVRTKLLTPPSGESPLLGRFTGVTSLERWIRIVGMRLGLDAARSSQRRQARERTLPGALPERDPEFYWMRQLYTENFERILSGCLVALPVRDRNLLKAQILHGMSLDEMARVWSVHRATIARWLRAARLGLLCAVRTGLQVQAGLSDSEVDSVLNLIRSGVSEGVIARGLISRDS
ncbi:MAG: sigma-70 family RNA polymerase sigma factor [Nannocystaceae bacterium]|nr:sigma-70 family RNA polymerase sigma factor [Nannocystaceae bacterium]